MLVSGITVHIKGRYCLYKKHVSFLFSVFEILLEFSISQDWSKALTTNLPKRQSEPHHKFSSLPSDENKDALQVQDYTSTDNMADEKDQSEEGSTTCVS